MKWKGRRKRSAVPVPNENKLGGRVIIADKAGAVQSALRVGHLGIARNNPDYLKVFVMNTLLGGYFSSRINMNLREVHGYTYGG
ncbi:MAG TPA: insulinase family protein, partial [Candidatus Kryptobacter bacterium]|nr:insulinase family protein [Candidatus Kryptobacter bacterium]